MTEELAVGTKVRVKDGVKAPDLPEFSLAGWTGAIVELSGKKSGRKYIIEWDGDTLQNMPPDYLKQCEARQLFHLMACLNAEDVEAAGG